jgi:hypothetical protein
VPSAIMATSFPSRHTECAYYDKDGQECPSYNSVGPAGAEHYRVVGNEGLVGV